MTTFLDMIGKFHPLLLHLPIGVLVYAYLHLGFDLYIRKKEKQPVDIYFALVVGALTAIMSTLSGYLLSQNGEYGGELLDLHKWLGIGTAVASVILLLLYKKSKSRKTFFGIFTLFMMLLTATGHYGGSLTHGEGFLTPSNSNSKEPAPIEDISKAHIFNDIIMPIANRKCVSCHNPKKIKGKLLLNTLDGWKKGGENGEFVIPGDLEKSLMLARIHLPISEKEHMPPSGKLQLDKEEITFIEWWIKSMSNYEETIEVLSPPDHIMKYINNKLDASTRNVPTIDKASIANLQKSGIPVQLMSMDKPWLSVAYDRGRSIKKDDLQKLSKYKENIRELILSKTDLNDNMLSKIKRFTNVKTLDLSLNPITTKGVFKLKDLKSLVNLNLYGTEVDAKIMDHLDNFPALEDIYLWQTKVAKDEIADYNIPKSLNVNLGQDLSAFGSVVLSSPTIEGDTVIFQDSIIVSISHIAKNSKIYYTLNGENPSNKSALYSEELILKKSTDVKAIASINGWENSAVASKTFLKSGSIPIACNVVPEPNEKYSSEGSETLINSVKATEQFGDGKWLGFSAQDVSITLDLGEEKEVETVSFGSLQDYISYIFNPIGSSISTSLDGKNFSKLKEEEYTQISGPADNLIKNFIIDIPATNTRYVKLDIISQKKNPKWHSDPGADCWLFIDEIVVE